ncbi:hypothetical protein EDD37DRAFT_674845 [Exophiala viscosa]|uniref:uncharacterized protein n=1 Tax=Exophiala viscosa TaxID=2486360 RepID=UPI002191265C|nr:hypothetical protein EDD37DRAFT_674845 [Exophiala viscosa]
MPWDALPGEYLHLLGFFAYSKQADFRTNLNVPSTFASCGPGIGKRAFQQNVNSFARRSLTYQEDALNAFKGILQAFRTPAQTKVKPVDNYVGIPLFSSGLGHTDVLVYGLDWNIDDEFNNDVIGLNHTPNETQIASAVRRPQFPSWTWLGWKIPKSLQLRFSSYPLTILLSHSRILTLLSSDSDLTGLPSFASCVDIFVQLSCGSLLLWEESRDTIMNLYLEGPVMPKLGIRGWMIDLDIPLDMVEQPRSVVDKVHFTDFHIDQRELAFAYLIAYNHGFPVRSQNGMVLLTLILLSRWSIPLHLKDIFSEHSMTAMVIVKANDANGDMAYERMGLIHLHFYRDPHPQIWDDETRSPGVDFTMKYSKDFIWLR